MQSINASTRRYEIFGQKATDNGFKPGSGDWWAELRRLREIDNQTIASNDTLMIFDDVHTEIQPGMVVTTQLGNKNDSDWSPKAPVLLLYTNVAFFGSIQFTGIYKKASGELFIAQYVTRFEEETQKSYSIHNGMESGMMYCTSSVPWDSKEMRSDCLGEKQNELIKEALRFHKHKIVKLPAIQRFVGDKPID
jgi:hypothetical protein